MLGWKMLNPAGLLWMTLMCFFMHPTSDIPPEEECLLVCSPSSYELIDGRLCICGDEG